MSAPYGTEGDRFDAPEAVSIKLKGGEYDLARREELLRELAPGSSSQNVVVDLTAVTFADSTALGCFLTLKKNMSEKHANPVIRLVGVRPAIARLFDITGMTKVFEITPLE